MNNNFATMTLDELLKEGADETDDCTVHGAEEQTCDDDRQGRDGELDEAEIHREERQRKEEGGEHRVERQTVHVV